MTANKERAINHMEATRREFKNSNVDGLTLSYAFHAIWYMLLYIAGLLEEKRCITE